MKLTTIHRIFWFWTDNKNGCIWKMNFKISSTNLVVSHISVYGLGLGLRLWRSPFAQFPFKFTLHTYNSRCFVTLILKINFSIIIIFRCFNEIKWIITHLLRISVGFQSCNGFILFSIQHWQYYVFRWKMNAWKGWQTIKRPFPTWSWHFMHIKTKRT